MRPVSSFDLRQQSGTDQTLSQRASDTEGMRLVGNKEAPERYFRDRMRLVGVDWTLARLRSPLNDSF